MFVRQNNRKNVSRESEGFQSPEPAQKDWLRSTEIKFDTGTGSVICLTTFKFKVCYVINIPTFLQYFQISETISNTLS